MAQWLSAWLETEGLRVRVSPASLPCGPWARHVYSSLVLVQPRKTRPCLTERLLMGRVRVSPASLPCGPWARHVYSSLVLVQPRKTRPCLTERLLMGRVRVSPASLPCGPWARHVYSSLVLVQPRKTRPCLAERLLMGRKESNLIVQRWIWPQAQWRPWHKTFLGGLVPCACLWLGPPCSYWGFLWLPLSASQEPISLFRLILCKYDWIVLCEDALLNLR